MRDAIKQIFFSYLIQKSSEPQGMINTHENVHVNTSQILDSADA
jgi:hypothetical protein